MSVYAEKSQYICKPKQRVPHQTNAEFSNGWPSKKIASTWAAKLFAKTALEIEETMEA